MALSDKGMEFKCGQMELVMKVSGRMESQMAEASSTILMGIFMKVTFLFKFINY